MSSAFYCSQEMREEKLEMERAPGTLPTYARKLRQGTPRRRWVKYTFTVYTSARIPRFMVAHAWFMDGANPVKYKKHPRVHVSLPFPTLTSTPRLLLHSRGVNEAKRIELLRTYYFSLCRTVFLNFFSWKLFVFVLMKTLQMLIMIVSECISERTIDRRIKQSNKN